MSWKEAPRISFDAPVVTSDVFVFEEADVQAPDDIVEIQDPNDVYVFISHGPPPSASATGPWAQPVEEPEPEPESPGPGHFSLVRHDAMLASIMHLDLLG